MKQFWYYKSPYFFWLAAGITITLWLWLDHSKLIFHIHQSYIVVKYWQFMLYLTIYFLVIGSSYSYAIQEQQPLEPILNFLHIAGTLGGVLAMVILPNPYHFEQRDPAILHSYWKPSWYTPLILSMRNILPYIVASAQLVFIANMAISYYRKEKN